MRDAVKIGVKKIYSWKKIFIVVISLIIIFQFCEYKISYKRYIERVNPFEASEMCNDRNSFTVVSYNIRCKTFMDMGEKHWFYRADLVVDNLRDMQPDLIGFQEVTSEQYQYLNENLKKYAGVIEYRDNSLWSEGCPIFYNTNRYDFIMSNTFWLSETPEEMSKDWGSSNYRICTCVILYDKFSEREIAVFNTHLDHKSEEARENGIKVILEKISELEDVPIILLGDFNANELSSTYQLASEILKDTKYLALETEKNISYNAWGEEKNSSLIDYIFITNDSFLVDRYYVKDVGQIYPSDHFPICVKLTFK